MLIRINEGRRKGRGRGPWLLKTKENGSYPALCFCSIRFTPSYLQSSKKLIRLLLGLLMEMQIFTYNTLFHSKWTEGWGKPESWSPGSGSLADWSIISVFQISVQKNPKVWLHSDFPLVASTLTLKKFLQVSMSLNKVRIRAWVFSKSASARCNMKGLCSEGYSLAGALQDQRKSPPESSFCFGLTQDLPEPVILSIIFHGLWIRLLIVNSALAAQSDTSWDHLAQKPGRRFPEKSCPGLPRDPAESMTESLHWSQ